MNKQILQRGRRDGVVYNPSTSLRGRQRRRGARAGRVRARGAQAVRAGAAAEGAAWGEGEGCRGAL